MKTTPLFVTLLLAGALTAGAKVTIRARSDSLRGEEESLIQWLS